MKNIVQKYSRKLFKFHPQTYYHSLRVAQISRTIGNIIGISESELNELYYAALLHDIGKLCIPLDVLKKPDLLTSEEWELIKEHPRKITEILNPQEYQKINTIIPAILQHHERYNGKGYPNGLKGEEINFYARIIAIADAYDAMTTDRVYKTKILSPQEAFQEILDNAGSQFDYFVIKEIQKTNISELDKEHLINKRILNQKQRI